jgi:GTPase SAR1 family protein
MNVNLQEEEEQKKANSQIVSSLDQPDKQREPIKMVVVGPGGGGKSSVIQSMFMCPFDSNIKSTNCYEVNRKFLHLDDSEYELRIWDCSAYHDQSYSTVKRVYIYNILKAFYRGSTCALIVVDVD